jgi:hypothetical protein
MFIKDGKTLFGNTGLIISFLVLVVLLYLSYNKCYNVELFGVPDPTKPEPTDVRVIISGASATLSFSIPNNINNPDIKMPDKFVAILSQYDKDMKNTGNNRIVSSNEYELNSGVAVNNEVYNTNMCSIVNGRPVCTYKFSSLDVLDSDGNPYYYKIGVTAVYGDYNTGFKTPYNVTTPNQMFTLQATAEEQSKIYSDFNNYRQTTVQQRNRNPSAVLYDNTMATADGQYELIKSQLGGYPDNLVLDNQSIDQQTLNDLVDKTLSPMIVSVNVA